MNQVIDLLEARIRHLQSEQDRNPRAEYGKLCHIRRLEAEHLLQKVMDLVEPKNDDPSHQS